MSESESISQLPLLVVKKCRSAFCGFHPPEEIFKDGRWYGYCIRAVIRHKQTTKLWIQNNRKAIRATEKRRLAIPENRAKLRQREKLKKKRQALNRPEVAKERRRRKQAARKIRTQGGDATTGIIRDAKIAATHCRYCRLELRDAADKTTDHILPLCRGGAHSMANIVICCKDCNQSKGTKTIWEWSVEMGSKLAPEWRIVRIAS